MIDEETQTKEDREARAELIRQGLLYPLDQQKAARDTHERFERGAGLPDFIRRSVR